MLLLSLIMSFYLCGLGVKKSRLKQLDEIQVKTINTSNGKNLHKCPALIFEFTCVVFGIRINNLQLAYFLFNLFSLFLSYLLMLINLN